MKLKSLISMAALVALFCGTAQAQTVEVKDAWVRTTVPGQRATGAFMKITAKEGTPAGRRVNARGRCGRGA